MKLKFSLITRRIFLNTLLFGFLAAFFSEIFYAVIRFAFPTLGKEPDVIRDGLMITASTLPDRPRRLSKSSSLLKKGIS
jgi:hypothetical protein